jgi:hypothetical protein
MELPIVWACRHTCKFCGGSGATSGRQGQRFLHRDKAPLVVITRAEHCTLRVTLAVPHAENGPQGDTFRNHGGHQIKCHGRTPKNSLCVCACVRVSFAVCHAITVQYHYSGNVFDSPSYNRIYIRKVESRVLIANRCAPWKIFNGAGTRYICSP